MAQDVNEFFIQLSTILPNITLNAMYHFLLLLSLLYGDGNSQTNWMLCVLPIVNSDQADTYENHCQSRQQQEEKRKLRGIFDFITRQFVQMQNQLR